MTIAKTPSQKGSADVYAHKLFAPASLAAGVCRDAILDRVFQDDALRVVVLQGPAGHGKSTTLQQIKSQCQTKGWLTGWLTFDEADNDIRRFHLHLQALFAGVSETAAGVPAERGATRQRRRAELLLDHLHRLGRPVGLFLDDVQTLADPAILGFIRELFEHIPQNVTFFIGSRSMPELGLARLLVAGQALLLRADDLRFSSGEVEKFFSSASGPEVSRAEVDAIYRCTEGWPAALQLFRLSLASPSVRRALGDVATGRPRELAEYLTDSVLSLQPPRVQEFLLRTSLLTRLTAPLCDALMGWQESQQMLLYLERSGLFVRTLDTDLRWFRYHALFSSFLAEQLRAQFPDDFSKVHQRAADWYLAHGDLEEAVHHAVECGNFTLAADTLNQWSSTLVAGGQLMTVARWYDRMPFKEIARRTDLAIKVAYALVFLRRWDKLPPLLEMLEAHKASGAIADSTNPDIVLSMAAICADDIPRAFDIIDRVDVCDQQPEGFAAFELGAGANLVGYRYGMVGEFERAHEYIAHARAYNQRGDASFSGGYTFGIRGLNTLLQGSLTDALAQFRQGMDEQSLQLDKSFASAALVSCYVWGLYEADELDQVESLYLQNYDAVTDAVLLDFLALAVLAMSRTHDARGRAAKALETLDEADNIARVNGWQRLARIIGWERVRLSLLSGATDKARSIAACIAQTPSPLPVGWVPFSEEAEGEGLGRIRLAVHTLDFDTAAELLAEEFGRNESRRYRRIRLHLLSALLHKKKGALNAANRCLLKALQLGEAGGFIRCILDEGEDIVWLLREAYQIILNGCSVDAEAESMRGYVERLLRASGTDLSHTLRRVSDNRPVEPLTEREREILAFLANGVSNKEMARRLFVSENTVKFHLKNIYSKLSVGNRLQAISSARQQGLVH